VTKLNVRNERYVIKYLIWYKNWKPTKMLGPTQPTCTFWDKEQECQHWWRTQT